MMHFNSDGTTGFRGKICFFNSFSKSVVLILHYQLLFFQSGRFQRQDELDWGAAGTCDWTSVLEVWNGIHGILKCNL